MDNFCLQVIFPCKVKVILLNSERLKYSTSKTNTVLRKRKETPLNEISIETTEARRHGFIFDVNSIKKPCLRASVVRILNHLGQLIDHLIDLFLRIVFTE